MARAIEIEGSNYANGDRVTKTLIGFKDIAALGGGGDEPMKFDFFDGALWKDKVTSPAEDGTVTVTLSTGKKVTVNSRLLGLLRVLADELARKETKLH